MDKDTTETESSLKPNKIGDYVLLAKIATGGMAGIYLARREGPGGFEKLVVLKRILPHISEDKDFIDMFLDEANIAARLDHQNIVQIYDLGRAGEEYYIAMEYLRGASFAEVIVDAREKRRTLNPYFCAALVSQVCEGLHFAHTAKLADGAPMEVVHRDINHRNLIVTFTGIAKIVDFGIAKARGRLSRTCTGNVKGTFSYMSPEQCRGEDLDQRSDIFSVGVVFYELLSMKKLFKRANQVATTQAIIQDEIPLIEERRPDVDPSLTRIAYKALSRKKEDRYQSARDMQRDILKAMDRAGSRVGVPEISEYMQQHMHEHLEKHRLLIEKAKTVYTGSGPTSLDSRDTEIDIPMSTPSEIPILLDRPISPRVVELPRSKVFPVMLTLMSVVLLAAVGLAAFWLSRGEKPKTPADRADLAVEGPVGMAPASLVVETEPPGATLYVNGRKMAEMTPVTMGELDPKKPVRIRAELAGFKPIEQVEHVAPGVVTEIHLVFAKLSSYIELTGAPPMALVKVDGVSRGNAKGSSPFLVELDPGVEHVLRVEKPGFVPYKNRVRLDGGERKKLNIRLKRRKPSHGTLEVNCVPWCSINIDGRDIGRNSPAKGIKLTTGKHRLRVVNPPTGLTKELIIVIKKDRNTRQVIRLQ